MRIIGGKVRGLKINTLEGEATRPTKDMVREALFSILYDKVYDSVFLDLFAGSGACGIEALSRGAKMAYFCDISPDSIKIIQENVKKAKFEDFSRVFNQDYKQFLGSLSDIQFDIVFIDPPYNKGLGLESINLISSYNLLKKNGIIIYETDKIEVVPDSIGDFEKYKSKNYGRNVLSFFARKE